MQHTRDVIARTLRERGVGRTSFSGWLALTHSPPRPRRSGGLDGSPNFQGGVVNYILEEINLWKKGHLG